MFYESGKLGLQALPALAAEIWLYMGVTLRGGIVRLGRPDVCSAKTAKTVKCQLPMRHSRFRRIDRLFKLGTLDSPATTSTDHQITKSCAILYRLGECIRAGDVTSLKD